VKILQLQFFANQGVFWNPAIGLADLIFAKRDNSKELLA
jgi:hypothetical protein